MFSLKKKGKVVRPHSPGADRPAWFQGGLGEGDPFFPHLPPFLPEEFSERELPVLLPWLNEAPPLHSLRKQRDPAGDFFFRDPWAMEVVEPFDEWTGFSDWNEGEAKRKKREGHSPESDGVKDAFRPGSPFRKRRRNAGRMESVERLSPSMDETELLDKMEIRSHSR